MMFGGVEILKIKETKFFQRERSFIYLRPQQYSNLILIKSKYYIL